MWNLNRCKKQQDTGLAVATRCMLIGRGHNGAQFKLQNEAMKDVLARCFKKTAVQVCTVIVCICRLVTSCIHILCCYFLHSGNLIHNIDWCLFFCRLKINHDSHEFILESGTIMNRQSVYRQNVYLDKTYKDKTSQVNKFPKRPANFHVFYFKHSC